MLLVLSLSLLVSSCGKNDKKEESNASISSTESKTQIVEIGAAGGEITASAGAPSSESPKEYDTHFDYNLGEKYIFLGGRWTKVEGNSGDWLSGNGLPESANGRDGEYYVDLETDSIYFKINGEWKPIGDFLGLLYGPDLPNDSEGNDNDTYIDVRKLNVYFKEDGKWRYVYTFPSNTIIVNVEDEKFKEISSSYPLGSIMVNLSSYGVYELTAEGLKVVRNLENGIFTCSLGDNGFPNGSGTNGDVCISSDGRFFNFTGGRWDHQASIEFPKYDGFSYPATYVDTLPTNLSELKEGEVFIVRSNREHWQFLGDKLVLQVEGIEITNGENGDRGEDGDDGQSVKRVVEVIDDLSADEIAIAKESGAIVLPYLEQSSQTKNSTQAVTYSEVVDSESVEDIQLVFGFEIPQSIIDDRDSVSTIKLDLDITKFNHHGYVGTEALCISGPIKSCSGHLFHQRGWKGLINPNFFTEIDGPINTLFSDKLTARDTGRFKYVLAMPSANIEEIFEVSVSRILALLHESRTNKVYFILTDDAKFNSRPKLKIEYFTVE